MSEKKFTPGPWKWNEDDWSLFERNEEDEDVQKYLDLRLTGEHGIDIIPIRVDHQEYILDTSVTCAEPKRADRDLIAAAPDLYDALEAMILSYEYEASMDNPALLQAKAALAKARGEM